MNYTPLILGVLGLFGILIHNLVKLNSINRKAKGNLNFGEYLKIEMFSIMISVCVVIVALIAQQEIKQLQAVSQYLGLSFVAIGYMAQSLVIQFIGKAQKLIDLSDSEKEDK